MLSTTAERISCSCLLKYRHQASPVCSSCLIGLTVLMTSTSHARRLRLYHPPLAANDGLAGGDGLRIPTVLVAAQRLTLTHRNLEVSEQGGASHHARPAGLTTKWMALPTCTDCREQDRFLLKHAIFPSSGRTAPLIGQATIFARASAS